MQRTVVGIFDSRSEADAAAAMLMDEGFERGAIDVRSTAAAERGGDETSESGSFWTWLFGESDDHGAFSERVSQGGALLAVTTDEPGVERARRILQREGGEIQSPAAPSEEPAVGRRHGTALAAGGERDQVLPVVEEQLKVGKRAIARGGVRVYSRVTERPVEEEVRLREERVHVDRRPVDRPLGRTTNPFEEAVIEMTETDEQVVIAKEARVVEEVVVSKDVGERIEDVREHVRRTDVQVERTGDGETAPGTPYQEYEADFRRHWQESGQRRGLAYEAGDPAYRFGCDLAGEGSAGGQDWSAVEPDARRRWEQRSPGTWEHFASLVQYAWERARGGRRRAA